MRDYFCQLVHVGTRLIEKKTKFLKMCIFILNVINLFEAQIENPESLPPKFTGNIS